VDLSSQGTPVFRQHVGGTAVVPGSLRAAPMLHIALVAYCLMNFQDALIGARRGDMFLVVGATFFTLLTGYMALRVVEFAICNHLLSERLQCARSMMGHSHIASKMPR
jgi:hypothetical protein